MGIATTQSGASYQTWAFNKTDGIVTIDGTTVPTPDSYSLSVDTATVLAIISTTDNVTYLVDSVNDTITINGSPFSGDVQALKIQLLTNVFSTAEISGVYEAIMSQTGTDAPTPIVLKNTLGFDLNWSRVDAGDYITSETLPYGKTAVFVSPNGLVATCTMLVAGVDNHTVSGPVEVYGYGGDLSTLTDTGDFYIRIIVRNI
jgi:hypothetical protein